MRGALSVMTTYVALLRGINVGGKNLIRMSDLKACFEAQGFENVSTYIQSGNVIFSAPASSAATLTAALEAALGKTFGYAARIVLRTRKQLDETVRLAPKGFGKDPAKYRYDVLFLMEAITAAAALDVVPCKEGVDQVHAGKGALYFSRLISKATQSRLNKLVALPIYKSMTIRNWNTTTKLLALMQEAEG